MNTTHHTARPETTDELAASLARAFHAEHEELFLVGGAVRDALLGQQGVRVELDFATSAEPGKTVQIIEALAIGSPYRVGEKFGTIGVALDGPTLEITTYRAEEKYEPGSRKPTVRFGGSLLEDLSRRDFTVNAIAQDPESREIIDPLGGGRDLAAGLIRAVGRAAERFREDPLRLLRGVRFASQLGFELEPATREAMVAEAGSLRSISRERVRDEYTRMLCGPDPARALTMLRDLGLMQQSVPDLDRLNAMPDHGPNHPLSLWDHTIRVVAGVPPVLSVRWAAVLHDIAKPETRTTEPNGRPRFFHHEEVGAQLAHRILSSLRYSNRQIESVVTLVGSHMQLHAYSPEWSDGAVRRLVLRLGSLTELAIALARADAAGHSLTGVSGSNAKFDLLQARIRSLTNEEVKTPKSPIDGDELMKHYGRPPGPWIKRVKEAICEALIDGEVMPDEVDAAWRIADRVLESEA